MRFLAGAALGLFIGYAVFSQVPYLNFPAEGETGRLARLAQDIDIESCTHIAEVLQRGSQDRICLWAPRYVQWYALVKRYGARKCVELSQPVPPLDYQALVARCLGYWP